MTLPTKSKTWQIQANIRSYNDPLSAANTNKAAIRALKDGLKAPALFPWVVESSSNAVSVGNNDQVDHWNSNSDIVPKAAGTAHSWLVLKQIGMGGQASLCIDFNDTSSAADEAQFTMSPNAGYGLTNGGVDGTILNRPTATDEVIISATNFDWGPGTTAVVPSSMNIWVSTDGEVTRVVMTANGRTEMILLMELPKNPISEWSPAVIGGHDQSTGFFYTRWSDETTANTKTKFRHNAVGNGTLTWAFMGTSNNISPNLASAQAMGDLEGKAMMLPVTLVSETATPLLRGTWGSMYDLYGAPFGLELGEMIEDDAGNIQWVAVENFWLPWSNAEGRLAR